MSCSDSVSRSQKGFTHCDLPSVKIRHGSICIADGHEKEALAECQSPIVNARSTDIERIT